MLGLRTRFQQLRALSSVATAVPQIDNSSDFLSRVPHRKHPGILHMNMAQLPKEAQDAVQILLRRSAVRQLEEHVSSLNNYLWSRKRPPEDRELREKAMELEQKFKENTHFESADIHIYQKDEKLKNDVLFTLRKNTYHWQPLSYTEQLGLVYLAARFDGGFAAVSRVLQEIYQGVPEFTPQTLMDFGSGVGAVPWAAHGIWGNKLKEYMCIDSSASMNTLSELVLRGGSEKGQMHISGIHYRQFLPVSPKVQFDLVVSAYSLNELPNFAEREKTIQTLWRKTGGFLVLVENGTREGHQLLMEARDIIIKGSDKEVWDHRPACVFAPCPHQLECPKLAGSSQTPCNFVQQYQPLKFKWNPSVRWEKFSFLIFSRGPVGENDRHWPRVVGPVLRKSRHVHCNTCCADGKLHHDVITPRRHGKDLYRCARNCEWGDRLPAIIPNSSPDKAEYDEKEPE
ncbi:methyltransferase-like protein 17, mitochondrial isoform X3 [Bufo bufo]|uniref:methyltransferase-like protein 17, mitochondrial isoform X3 n=1 Tax=Bufo bufo TaxID=8384 RepID=UPI001ABE9576|nr:methyltransferase-like protein 17, mitochondrial isoform X3 [Bufo bufo]